MYSLVVSSRFKKDIKTLTPADIEKVKVAIEILERTGTLPYNPYLTHPLKGKYKNHLEAHIKPDLLIIWYEVVGDVINLVRIGSHSKLFEK